MTALFVLSNVLIALGYFYIAFVLVPILPIRRLTVAGGVGFFMLCAATHLDSVYHVMLSPQDTFGEVAEAVHMQVIHLPQAVAIWVFAVGFVRDMHALERERRTTRPADV